MKLTCSISGIQFQVPQFPWMQSNLTTKHPIFHLPLSTLINQAGQWASGRMSDDEGKLLFLALLDNLGETRIDHIQIQKSVPQYSKLVIFKSPAQIDIKTVHRNMELLIAQILWKQNSISGNYDVARLPIYIVEYPSTHTLGNINSYLQAWQSANIRNHRANTDRYNNSMTMEMRAKQELVSKMIRSNLLKNKNYERFLGQICMDMMGYKPGMEMYDLWMKLFQLKEPEIYQTKISGGSGSLTTDLEELLETIESKLKIFTQEGSTHTKAILVHVRNLLLIHNKGPLALYDMDDINLTNAPIYIQKLRESAKNASATQPNSKTFKGSLAEFMKASCAWTNKQELDKLSNEHETKMKEQFKSRLLDEALAQEEGDMDEIEEINLVNTTLHLIGDRNE